MVSKNLDLLRWFHEPAQLLKLNTTNSNLNNMNDIQSVMIILMAKHANAKVEEIQD